MAEFDFNDSTFQYFLSKSEDKRFSKHCEISNGYIVSYTEKTDVISFNSGSITITIIGFCIDSYGEYIRSSIPEFLCGEANSISCLVESFGRLAGKFVIIYQKDSVTYVLNDATASVPVYYYKKESSFCSSEYILASHYNLNKNVVAQKINRMASPGLPLPYNLSSYEHIFFMLPNHYIDTMNLAPVRYYIPQSMKSETSYELIVQRSIYLIKNIVREYSKHYELICPITSGYDSRTVLSFLLDSVNPECYTFKHAFSAESAELKVPQKICFDLKLKHKQVTTVEPPIAFIEQLSSSLEDVDMEIRRIKLAYNIKKEFKEKAIVSGDIVGQIAKRGLFGNTPGWFNPNSYLLTKTHSFSKENSIETSNYLNKLKSEVPKNSIQDFFALEVRCGRWASRTSEVYNTVGVNMLNIFNCSELIMLWFLVDKEVRAEKVFVKDLMFEMQPKLLSYPFNGDDNLKAIKSNKYLFVLASFVKFSYQKSKYKLNKTI